MSKQIIERDVLASLLTDKSRIDQVQDIIKSEHFSSPYLKWAYEKLLAYYEKYCDVPKVSYFKIELSKNKDIDEDERSRWYKLIRDIYKKILDTGSTEYALDELIGFAKNNEVAKIIERGINHLDKGEWKDAIETLYATVEVQVKDKEFEISDWLATWEERQKVRKERKDDPSKDRRIKLPWPEVQKVIGGLGPGESTTIASLTNVGKSISLIVCGRRAFIDGKKVVHIVIEDTKEMVEQRYDSAILGIRYDDLKYFDLKKEEIEKLDRIVSETRTRIGSNLRIVKTKPKKTSIVTIIKALNILKQDGFIPDLLIIDYADIMIPSKTKYKSEQFRLEQAEVYWEIKSLAEQLNIPILTATQVSKEYVRKKAYSEGLAEAYDKSRILNVVLTLNQLDIQSRDILLIIAKNRDGEKGKEVALISNFAKMRLTEKIA
jgi:replicative DNA helicase